MSDRRIATVADWIERESRPGNIWFYKRLTPNDTGMTGGHQSGFLIPKSIARLLFPDLVDGGPNPFRPFPLDLDSHAWRCTDARVTHWNRGRKDEYQVTGLGGGGCPLQQAANTGRLMVLAMGPDGHQGHAWLAADDEDELALERVVGRVVDGGAGVHHPPQPSDAARGPGRAIGEPAAPRLNGRGSAVAPPSPPARSGQVADADVAIPSVGNETTEPDPGGTAEAFSQSGYRFEHAVADLVDNSVDAHADNVLIRFVTGGGSIERIVIADDGRGMDEAHLSAAMRYGARFPRSKGDLGKYGVGMKSASLSQCRSLSVVSRQSGSVCGRRWTEESIKRGWQCEILDSCAAETFLQRDWQPLRLAEHGTVIIWEGLDRLRAERDGLEATLETLLRSLRNHLGLVFHRYLERGQLRIMLDRVDGETWDGGLPSVVEPLDAFGYPISGAKGYPKSFRLDVDRAAALQLEAHIWPPKSKSPQYRLGGGRVASRQGFYFYRNDRLIQAGGWSGWRDNDSEPHLSLARVRIDLPPELDRTFGLNLHKSQIDVPPAFTVALDGATVGGLSMRRYVQDAEQAYRTANSVPGDRDAIPVPGAGLPASLRNLARQTVAGADPNVRGIRFAWDRLPEDAVVSFDRDADCIWLNTLHRKRILGGAKATGADAPLVKMLLFLVLRSQIQRERSSAASRRELVEINKLLLAAIRESPVER